MSQKQIKPNFELTGGHPSLDLTNTVDNRTSENPADNLRSYEDLLAFAQQAGVVSSSEAQQLARAAAHNPRAAETQPTGFSQKSRPTNRQRRP